MYGFAPVRPHLDHLWSLVVGAVPSLPPSLEWDVDLHAQWRDPALAISQTCGWPVVTELSDLVASGAVRVLGTFVPAIADVQGHTYRSVLVARSPEPGSLVGVRAAVNSTASLSGWVSLVHAVHGAGATWQGEVLLTGSHADSMVAVRDGRADVASIDALTFALQCRWFPDVVAGLHVVGHGPRVPCLPIIAGPAAAAVSTESLRDALRDAVVDASSAAARDALLIRDFMPLDATDYAVLTALAPAAP
jgi:ABC-type phosphate/phosphonate transport system substrate-binding protein